MTIRKLPPLMWCGLALIIASSLVHLWLEIDRGTRIAPELKKGPEQVARSYEVITAALSLRHAVQNAERGQRGFLITADPAYLDAYRQGSTEAPALLARLRTLTADNAEHQRRWPNVEHQISIKLGELERSLAVYERDGFDVARQRVQSSAGFDAMTAINGLTDAAVATERELLVDRLARTVDFERSGRSAALAGGILTLLVLLLGIALVLAGLRQTLAAEAARHESDQRFRYFVGNVKDYAIFALDPEGSVLDWNAGAARIKGYTAAEIVGKNFSLFYTEEDRAAGKPARALATAARDGKFETRAWRVRKNGTRFLANIHLDALRDAEGRLLGFVKITRDIDERVQQEEALAQYQKMDALGQLTGGIAHDFNNLIHVIKNATVLLEKRVPADDPQIVNYLEMLKRNAERAASLTQRLLAFSRRQVLDPKPIDPNTLIGDVAALLDQALGESVEVETVLGAGTWWIFADSNQLETAILNLGINARDAMPGGGKLTIEISNAFLDEHYANAHEEVTSGQYVMIAVSDNGTGMSQDVAAKAFTPFFTTKELGQGTGLGLSQVYGFMKQSGGHAKIYSEPEAGTTVKLYLPRFARPRIEHPKNVPAPLALGTGSDVVMVVEDDPDVREFTKDLLHQLGYRVVDAGDAASALKLLEQHGPVDLLFTDIGLPGGVNGRQLADQARALFPTLRVLFTTGYTRNAIIHHGRLDSGVVLIAKPFTHTALSAKVKEALDRHE